MTNYVDGDENFKLGLINYDMAIIPQPNKLLKQTDKDWKLNSKKAWLHHEEDMCVDF